MIAISAALGLGYALGHLLWYYETPLGQVPVLDELENLAFADGIARGSLPPEPFYRAPGYPLVLAAFRRAGVSTAGLFQAALLFGALLHAINAALSTAIARRFFPGHIAAVCAGVLYALNPVFVHYATQALDATLALTLFLGGLCTLAPEISRLPDTPDRPLRWAATSVLWAAATVTRPNYLLLSLTLPLLAAWPRISGNWKKHLPAALAGAAIYTAVAAWQWRVSNVAGFLPWQGPYNLWAANEPGAHGRYYVQKHSIPAAVTATQNPARAESIYLYRLATGAAPADIAALNAYWRKRFLEHVTAHPFAWLGQLARKAYAILNNWEQYNNKTFAFHQQRSPWLRWNPLCWGVLLTFGALGFVRLRAEQPQAALALAILAAVCASSVLLFFVSARFRLPLVAFATLLSAGALASPLFWRGWSRLRRASLALLLLGAPALAFSTFDHVNDRKTFVQDHALLARAASTTGDDTLAWHEAALALALQPSHNDALRLSVASYFNLLALDRPVPAPESAWHDAAVRFLSTPARDALDLRAVAALALWRDGSRSDALAEWRQLRDTPSAIAARLIVGEVAASEVNVASWPRRAWDEPLVRLAALRLNLPHPPDLRLGDTARASKTVTRLFASRGAPETKE